MKKTSGTFWSYEHKKKRCTLYLKIMKDSPRNRRLRTALENQPSWVTLQPQGLDTSQHSGSCNSHEEQASQTRKGLVHGLEGKTCEYSKTRD